MEQLLDHRLRGFAVYFPFDIKPGKNEFNIMVTRPKPRKGEAANAAPGGS